jgi:hypothetical protein
MTDRATALTCNFSGILVFVPGIYRGEAGVTMDLARICLGHGADQARSRMNRGDRVCGLQAVEIDATSGRAKSRPRFLYAKGKSKTPPERRGIDTEIYGDCV